MPGCCYGSSWVSCLVSAVGRVTFVAYGLAHLRGLVSKRVAYEVRCAYLFGGGARIARSVPWAGSVTGGEACGYPCSEKEGFTHPSLWRAPCFWGAKNVETARWV